MARGRKYPPSDRASAVYAPGHPKRVTIFAASASGQFQRFSLSRRDARALMVELIAAVDKAEAHKGAGRGGSRPADSAPPERSARKFSRTHGLLKKTKVAAPSRLAALEGAALRVRALAADLEIPDSLSAAIAELEALSRAHKK